MHSMNANTFGSIFSLTSFGESHGKAVGVVVDGCPSNVPICMEDFIQDLARRSPKGNAKESFESLLSTKRCEDDECEVLSGIFEGLTLGTPIAIIVRNKDAIPSHYESLQDVYRPGHGDHTYQKKFGHVMSSGGGRASGRETVGRVLGGTVARKLLEKIAKDKKKPNIKIETHLKEIAGIKLNNSLCKKNEIPRDVLDHIKKIKDDGDSIGAILECNVHNVDEGLGEPVFFKLEAMLSQGIMSIGGVKGIEFGSGFESASFLGSKQNDIRAHHNGGIFAGISSGEVISLSVALKPPSSIKKMQKAYTKDGAIKEISIEGRHDMCLYPRIVPVLEAMIYVSLADATLLQARKIISNTYLKE